MTNKIWSNLYKKYKRETKLEPWQLSEGHLLINSILGNKVSYLFFSEHMTITFEVRPNLELIIKSILKYFPYLKFWNSFRGIDNYNFASLQPWSSPCPICDGKHGNYGLHGSWYCENGNQLPYDPELAKLYSQDKLEYCLTCNTSSNKLKFAIVDRLVMWETITQCSMISTKDLHYLWIKTVWKSASEKTILERNFRTRYLCS